ncbi:MAG: (d)CMP kinase [Sutterellaceae bacterium]|nr:(d)CMP kinase [Burkholderiaceae bacterium]MCX7901214.1 (d)CMP kinase [Burkholderiaceae bacterium]MDW8430810.1 (d)CMP kinase [Sutterellaceae bacterium]
MTVPVIAIDGPTASGKGTVASRVAQALGFHYLDSGALYRLVALAALEAGVEADNVQELVRLARGLAPRFEAGRVWQDGRDLTLAIRREEVGRMASRIAVHAALRAELLRLQRAFRRPPGLVAEGRDMGTVVFPDAKLKVFLTASDEVRAARRYQQLIEQGFTANICDLLADLRARDERDMNRPVAPLKPAEDAYRLDSSALTIDEVVRCVLDRYRGEHTP